jgi:hypothetical protein
LGLDEKKSQKHWESVTRLTQAKVLILGPSARKTEDLLKLNRDPLRWVVALFTGHCHLVGHLFELGLTGDPLAKGALFKISSPGPVLYGSM